MLADDLVERGIDRDVAVKVMHPHLRGAREARARFAREGARIVVAEINEEIGRRTEEEIKAIGAEALYVKTDVSNEASTKEIMLEMGDVLVTLIINADLHGIDIEDCLYEALQKITKRKGKMVDGAFVKDTCESC